jgi:nucleoid-associated protein YgaU
MNKEAKVGLTIIFVLLVVFVVVLGRRMLGSRVADEVLTAKDRIEEQSEPNVDPVKETAKNVVKAINAIIPAGQPTVIQATAASAKPPKTSANEADLWNTASDAGKDRIPDGNVSDLKPAPSYMPEPPKPDSGQRYGRYKNSIPAESDSSSVSADSRRDYVRGQSNTSVVASRKYVVAEGDSLFDIARSELGKASRWVEIYDLNIDVFSGNDLDNLAPGTEIVLPDKNPQSIEQRSRRLGMEYR